MLVEEVELVVRVLLVGRETGRWRAAEPSALAMSSGIVAGMLV